MIRQEDLNQIDTVDGAEKIYEDLLANGKNAFGEKKDEKAKATLFSKSCHDLIHQYLAWNDYIHSNNILQLYKSEILKEWRITQKPMWLVRYEIIIYGRRTPLYFIDKPKKLFDKIHDALKKNDKSNVDKVSGAIEHLLKYYIHNYLSDSVNEQKKEEFKKHFNCNFIKEYSNTDSSAFPTEIRKHIDSFVDYVKEPSKYVDLGLPKETVELWDEEDEEISVVRKTNESASSGVKNEYRIDRDIYKLTVDDENELREQRLEGLKDKNIRLIGAVKSQSIVRDLNGAAKKFGFKIDIVDDYDKISNIDFRNMRYSSIDGVIVGPMPHSVKGKGNYSSLIEMLKNESGYPPVVECRISNGELKVSKRSLWHALGELGTKLKSL